MEEAADYLTPQSRRHPLTDASSRLNNCQTPKSECRGRTRRVQEQLKSPDRMSISNSPLSPRGYADNNRLSAVTDSQVESNRNSAVSATSILSGRGKRKTHVGPWQLGRTLGKGATGRVRLAKHAVTGQTAAIKIVSKKSAAMVQSESIAAMDRNASLFTGTLGTRQMPHGIEREVVIMKLIEHPNVISLYDVWENRGELYLVLEYVEGGELFDYVSNNGPLPEEEAVRLFRQIIAGLAYCHRFNICHRDLKPENILLDAKHNIKLADFGMAALQPAGHWLNTSCGSPHYAAPEIIYGRRYRGDRADMWSCGIILFALLTGFLPFDGGDLPNTLRLVKKGEYFLPPWLSDEAADLIQRILQKRPEDRISMQNIWMHPLLRKYEKLHQAMSDHFVGPPPPLSAKDCGPPVLSRQEIDIDLLRNLQTLWHTAKPETLIERLLSSEPSHERMFYNALVKFRDEQLENYQGQPLEYSASDYHHISRPAGRAGSKRSQSARAQGHSRRRSQFSVVSDREARFVKSIKEPKSCTTIESYDPYRSPRYNNRGEAQYAQITIHRKSSGASRKVSTSDTAADPSNAVDMDVDEQDAGCPPSSPFEVLRNRKTKANSVRSFQSKVSQSSSRRGMNGGSTTRSVSYRRNVSFRHVRNRSQGSASASAKMKATQVQHPDSRKHPSEVSLQVAATDNQLPDMPSSPVLPAQPKVVRAGHGIKNGCEVRKVRDFSHRWKDEARKVSHELSQICEEAFNGGSLSTVCTTSTCDGAETPATSVSMASPEVSQHLTSTPKATGRPLPETPAEPPRSYSIAELTETRRKLIEHSTRDGSDDIPGYLVGVIAHLDRLIEQDKWTQSAKFEEVDECVHSLPDPFVRSTNDAGYLPVISEEMLTPIHSTDDLSKKGQETKNTSQSTRNSFFRRDGKATIRMVPHDSLKSLEEIKPLMIRKRNNPTPLRTDSLSSLEELATKLERQSDHSTRYMPVSSRQPRFPGGLDPIAEVPKCPRRSEVRPSGENKKWSWFKHKSQVCEEATPKLLKEIQPIHPSNATVIIHEVKQPEEPQKPANEPEQLNRKVSSEKLKGGFLRKLMKKKSSKNIPEAAAREDTLRQFQCINSPCPETASEEVEPPVKVPGGREVSYETVNSRKPSEEIPPPQPAGKSQNWFARVFQIKPATRVVALNTSKIKARKHVYKVLREWKQYGMEDVYLDKANSVIHGKVGDDNLPRLKPVHFSAEFYTVLEHGRQANLSLVRFKQERGAASSFNKVVDMLCNVLKQRGLLVEDPARAKKMARVLDSFQ